MPNPRAAGTTTEMIVRFTDKGDYWVYDIGANSILTAQDAAILPPGAPFPPPVGILPAALTLQIQLRWEALSSGTSAPQTCRTSICATC